MTNPPRRNANCPICSRPTTPETRPFCSRRCRDVDLARWFGEEYRIPTEEGLDDSLGDDAEDGER